MKVIVDVTEDFFNWTKMCGIMPFLRDGIIIPEDAGHLYAEKDIEESDMNEYQVGIALDVLENVKPIV